LTHSTIQSHACQRTARLMMYPLGNWPFLPDMGLGKTLQTLGLILSNPPDGQTYPIKFERGRKARERPPRCTLIVCPVSVMANWVHQTNKHVNKSVKNKYLSVEVYHGAYNISVVRQSKSFLSFFVMHRGKSTTASESSRK